LGHMAERKSLIMKINRLPLSMIVLAALLLASCQNKLTAPPFDGARAYNLLLAQTDLGPRNPGSAGWHKFQTMMSGFLDSLGVNYETQPFDYDDYLTGETLHLVNWIIHIKPGASDRILLAAHYDSRPRAEHDPDSTQRDKPILGANDGASGVAVLMHLAELLHAHQPPTGVDIVLFDGEDYGPPGRNDQYLIGSTYFAAHNTTHYQYGILLDMIGDRDLRIYRESLSERYARKVDDRIWQAAARLGVSQFVDSVKFDVLDDHIPLIAAGISTVDLIDFEYPYWHTQADTPDKCDPASLSAVGRVILEVIYGK
jgi:glutaminyl-peptide cyclotransferase